MTGTGHRLRVGIKMCGDNAADTRPRRAERAVLGRSDALPVQGSGDGSRNADSFHGVDIEERWLRTSAGCPPAP